MAQTIRFYDFIKTVKNRLKNKATREKYVDTLDEWLGEAVREENWETAEAFAAAILRIDPDYFDDFK